jgi:hypothetical protein
MMNELLRSVLNAHGGIDRWNSYHTVDANIVTSGSLWGTKGLVQDTSVRRMTVSLHEQRASLTPFGAPGQRTNYSPERIAIESANGSVLAELVQPRVSFSGHQMNTAWSPLQRAYFNGYALWTYLTTPFLLAMSDAVQELDPWIEGDEEWRRLRISFPHYIATHSETQDFFFDENYHLCRHDYSVDIAGGFHAAQYVSDYIEANGIFLPTKRRAFKRDANDFPLRDELMVAIDLSDIRFS